MVTNILCRQEINFDLLKNNPEYLYINLFAAPLENTGLLKSILEQLNGIITDVTSLTIKMNVNDLLIHLAEKQPMLFKDSLMS